VQAFDRVASPIQVFINFLPNVTEGRNDDALEHQPLPDRVWFCVGFFTGAGWALAAWLVGRIFSHI
jgi:hypothetical protein